MIKLFVKIFSTLFVLLLLGYFTLVYIIPELSKHEEKQLSSVKEVHFVKRVIDGDTFELDTKERVRVLGIDSPEKFESGKLDKDAERTGQDKKTIQKLGELASEHARNLIEGKKVTLLPEQNYDDKDVYGRLLRYVYLEDGTFFNLKMVDDGYAYAFRKYPISRLDEFIKAEKDARTNKRGIWGDVGGLKQVDDITPEKEKSQRKRDTKNNKK